MSCTLAHSRREWYSEPPVKRFGVGSPRCESRAPSVPPRMIVCTGSSPSAAHRLLGRLDHLRVLRRSPRPCSGTAPPRRRRPSPAAPARVISAASRRSSSTCSPIFAASWSRTISSTIASSAPPPIFVGWTKPSRSSVVSGESESRGQRRDEVGGELDRVHELPLRGAGVRRAAADRDDDLRRVERLGLDLAGRGAVERVRELGAEALEVEVVGTARDLLVDREADADRRVRAPGFRFRYATAAMISATPALSSAPSRVVPSVVTRSWPTFPFSRGSSSGSSTTLESPGSSMRPPS